MRKQTWHEIQLSKDNPKITDTVWRRFKTAKKARRFILAREKQGYWLSRHWRLVGLAKRKKPIKIEDFYITPC
jgi:hypothetical protein